MRKTWFFGLVAGAALALPFTADAADSNVPTLGQILGVSGIELSGYVDTTYTYLSGSGQFTSGTDDRVFDYHHNSFNLNAIDLGVSYLPKSGFGASTELLFGQDAQKTVSYGGPSPSANFDFLHAYVQYAYGKWTFMAGKMGTLAGAEVIESPEDTNISRSIIFGYAEPFAHTGVRASYALNDKVTLTAGVNNGFDKLKDNNSQKTGEAAISIQPTQKLSLSAASYFGDSGDRGGQFRYLVDFVGSYALTNRLSFVVNYDYDHIENGVSPGRNAVFDGVAGYMNYRIAPKWLASLRGEYFNDPGGAATGVAQKWKEATLSLGYMPIEHFEVRGEGRYDWSNRRSFAETGGGSRNHQYSLEFEGIYKFGL